MSATPYAQLRQYNSTNLTPFLINCIILTYPKLIQRDRVNDRQQLDKPSSFEDSEGEEKQVSR